MNKLEKRKALKLKFNSEHPNKMAIIFELDKDRRFSNGKKSMPILVDCNMKQA